MRCTLLLVIFLIASQARAEDPPWIDAICTVSAGSARGTGVLISEDNGVGHLLTNHHVVGRTVNVSCKWINGYALRGTVVWKDKGADQALVRLSVPRGVSTLPGAQKGERPRQGENVQLAGFGGTSGKLTVWNGVVNGYLESSKGAHQIEVNVNSISGDSGGAIVFNDKLAAVLWGGPVSNGRMYATRGTIAQYAADCCTGVT